MSSPWNDGVDYKNPEAAQMFDTQVSQVLAELRVLLTTKNRKYGDSALTPIRVFSKASPTEQLLVRLDDKLSRLKVQTIEQDEDVLLDLLGYLVLLRVATKKGGHYARS